MKTHHLKTWPEYFNAVVSGEKTFEVRKNDRDFQVGDILNLFYFEPLERQLDGVEFNLIKKKITYILHGGQFGIEEGYCVMGLEDV